MGRSVLLRAFVEPGEAIFKVVKDGFGVFTGAKPVNGEVG